MARPRSGPAITSSHYLVPIIFFIDGDTVNTYNARRFDPPYPERDAMLSYRLIQRWTALLTLAAVITTAGWGCSPVPRRYLWMSEPNVTLTMLSANPQPYVGKVVLLGGTITEVQEQDQFLWLRLKNRPLDQDYKPHRPADSGSAEAGSYWVFVSKQQVPPKYRNWARTTVVARVTGEQRFQTEPILMLLYMRGWGASGNDAGIWENVDPNYVPSVPGSIDMRNP